MPTPRSRSRGHRRFRRRLLHPRRRHDPRPASGSAVMKRGLTSYSIADIHLFRLFWRLNASLRLSPGAFPNLSAHHDRMLARPAVQRTIEAEAAIGYELPA
ncbi:glutathione binding-like protein [Roseomonas mucosa]|uniref:glutathione binding-like protein n=1 Tax=Roseomonas mucosa TaxID=207340 RepID=UPI003979C5D2